MKKLMIAMAAAAVCGAAFAEEETATNAPETTVEENDSIVSAEASLKFDSKYLSYGFVDNRAPILTPGAEVSFFDALTVGVEAIFDTTPYGRAAGYGNRGGKYSELHPYLEVSHSFTSEDFEWLPTTVDVSLNWMYEYHPEFKARHGYHDRTWDDNTHFLTLEFGLPDLWLEPVFYIERDLMRDDGTYVNLELGHTFALVEGESEEDDAVLTLRPSVAQGFGNNQRVKAYAVRETYGEGYNRAGFMDTMFKLAMEWKLCDAAKISGYVGYSDFLLDRRIRHGARNYEWSGRWDESWNFVCGLALIVGF
jgi:hypothetical protein